MKKELAYILNFIFILFLSSDIQAAQEQQIVGKILIGNSSFFWQVEGEREFREGMQKKLAACKGSKQEEGFTFTSNGVAVQISTDGKLSVPADKHHVVVKDRFSKILNRKTKKQKQSLDEDDNNKMIR